MKQIDLFIKSILHMNLIKYLCVFAFIIQLDPVFAQEEELAESPKVEHRHAVSLMVGYAWVPQIVSSTGEQELLVIPSLGLDYSYVFSHRFAISLINDVELSRYLVEDGDAFLERNNKYIGAIVALYKPHEILGIYAGPGIEIDHHATLPLIKIGFEFAKHFEDGWAVGTGLSVDLNEVYQTISFGIFIVRGW